MTTTVVTATAAAMTAGDIGAGLGLVMVLTLIGLLAQRELTAVVGSRLQELPRTLSVAIVPLLTAFMVIAISRLLTMS